MTDLINGGGQGEGLPRPYQCKTEGLKTQTFLYPHSNLRPEGLRKCPGNPPLKEV